MSNKRLFVILLFILLILLALGVRQIYLYGPYAGLVVGIYLVPILFIIYLMIGIALGFRKSNENTNRNSEENEHNPPRRVNGALIYA